MWSREAVVRERNGAGAVPKSYEDEIRELLKGMDRFPGEGAPARRAPSRRWSMPSIGALNPFSGAIDARRLMGGALILMLFAWILRGPWSTGFGGLVSLAGYISLASLVLFVVALIMMIRGSGFGGGYSPPQRWRGRVIDSRESRVIRMPRRGGLLDSWRRWWRTRSQSFSRGPRRPGGRDSLQW
jgi:hypothetical protein